MGWLKKYQQGGKKDKGFSIEGRVNKWLNDPQGKARKDAENKSGDGDEEIDNIRHASAGRYAAEAIANKTGNIPYVSKPLGVIGANIMGLGHEIGTYVTDPRWTDKNWKVSNFDKAKVISRELLEDAYNNFAGSVIGATDMTPEQKTARIKYLSQNYMIPDGYGLLHPYGDNPTFVDPYSKKKYGGYSTTGYKANSPDKDNPYNIIPSGRITMQNVPHPVLGIDNLGNRQMMMPGGEYQFQGNEVFEMPVMKEGGIPERYKNMGFSRVGQKKSGDGQHKWKVLAKKGDSYKVVQGGYRGMQDFKQHHSEERRDRFWDRMGGKNSSKAKDPFSPLYWHKRFGTWEYGGPVEMQNGGDARTASDNTYVQEPFIPASLPRASYNGPVMREASYISPAYRDQLEREYNWKHTKQNVVKPLLQGADIVTDVMQFGNFIPHPIAQAVGKVGNVLGTGIDALQAGMDLGDGNYGSAAVNASSMLLPIGLESQTFRRNSKYLQPGQPLYPFSPQALGSSKRVQYIEPFTATRHMTDNNLLANRALLGTLATETAIDTKKQGGMIKRADGSYSQRGLWDNIRANAGSGKKPTKEMLQQEKKIRAAEKKEYGGWLSKYK